MRWAIAILTALAALFAALNEVASLDRIASSHLNFPVGLAWTLPGSVTIATLAGALMWTLLHDVPLRAAGRRLNITCALISAAAVGLDHTAGADGWWAVPAGLVGALVPALATWLTHLLARMTADPAVGVSPVTQPQQRPAPDGTVGVSIPVTPALPDQTQSVGSAKRPSNTRGGGESPPASATASTPAERPMHLVADPAVDEDGDALAVVARLVATGKAGRGTVARELGVKPHEARVLIDRVKAGSR